MSHSAPQQAPQQTPDGPVVVILPNAVRSHLARAVRRHLAVLRQKQEPVAAPVLTALRQISVIAGQEWSRPHDLSNIDHGEHVAPLLVDCAEAARLLAISESGVRRLVRNHQLQAVRIGGSPRYRIADLHAYVESLPTQDSAESDTTQESESA